MICHVGNDNLGSTQIYAVNGWNDIDIIYNGHFSSPDLGRLYCSDNYQNSCDIASDDWSCADADSNCNFVTSTPTKSPSNISTKLPTLSPTMSITALYTTKSPTISPSYYHNNQSNGQYGDTNDEIQVFKQYEPTKDRGISWMLEMRIIFGIGVIFIIIVMLICCWYHKKHPHSSSFYHHKATDPEIIPFEHHIRSIPLSFNDNEAQFEVEAHTKSVQTSKSFTAASTKNTAFSK